MGKAGEARRCANASPASAGAKPNVIVKSFFDRVDVFDFRQHRRRITDSSTFFAEATNGEP
jgi:hypothetical protein